MNWRKGYGATFDPANHDYTKIPPIIGFSIATMREIMKEEFEDEPYYFEWIYQDELEQEL